jgi:hypothetical protein
MSAGFHVLRFFLQVKPEKHRADTVEVSEMLH